MVFPGIVNDMLLDEVNVTQQYVYKQKTISLVKKCKYFADNEEGFK
jgi:hypothetical protein